MKNKELRLSNENEIIFGVCGGIAEYLNVDPTLIRIIAVILLFASNGGAIFLYILASVFLPEPRDLPNKDDKYYQKDFVDDEFNDNIDSNDDNWSDF